MMKNWERESEVKWRKTEKECCLLLRYRFKSFVKNICILIYSFFFQIELLLLLRILVFVKFFPTMRFKTSNRERNHVTWRWHYSLFSIVQVLSLYPHYYLHTNLEKKHSWSKSFRFWGFPFFYVKASKHLRLGNHLSELEVDVLAGQLLVYRCECIDFVLNVDLLGFVQMNFDHARAVHLDTDALANDLSWVDDVV